MHFPPSNNDLLIVSKFLKFLDKALCKHHRLLVVQHLTPDVAMFIRYLCKCNFASFQVISIEYSRNSEIIISLKNDGINILEPNFDKLVEEVEKQIYINLKEAERLDQKLLIHEVGGYAAPVVSQLDKKHCTLLSGIVEETAQGKWQYASYPKLPIPVLHIASSSIKEIESQYVGRTIADSLEAFTSKLDLRIDELQLSIFGYGTIGSAVARVFKEKGVQVSIFDINPIRMLSAYLSGHQIGSRLELLKKADILLGVTGVQSTSLEDVSLMKDRAILCSASSKQVELPVNEINDAALDVTSLAPDYQKYTLPNKRAIIILHNGYPINLGYQNVPTQIMDLLHAETLLCINEIMNNKYKPGLHSISQSLEAYVAKAWLDSYK